DWALHLTIWTGWTGQRWPGWTVVVGLAWRRRLAETRVGLRHRWLIRGRAGVSPRTPAHHAPRARLAPTGALAGVGPHAERVVAFPGAAALHPTMVFAVAVDVPRLAPGDDRDRSVSPVAADEGAARLPDEDVQILHGPIGHTEESVTVATVDLDGVRV